MVPAGVQIEPSQISDVDLSNLIGEMGTVEEVSKRLLPLPAGLVPS